MHVLEIETLPESAIKAAADFYRDILPGLANAFADHNCVILQLPKATSDHDDWRRSAARDVARAYAPKRFNIIGGGSSGSVSETRAYLETAEAVTGQYLKLAS